MQEHASAQVPPAAIDRAPEKARPFLPVAAVVIGAARQPQADSTGDARPLGPSDGSVLNLPGEARVEQHLDGPGGHVDMGTPVGGRASNTHTVAGGVSISRRARIDPAAPLPTIT